MKLYTEKAHDFSRVTSRGSGQGGCQNVNHGSHQAGPGRGRSPADHTFRRY